MNKYKFLSSLIAALFFTYFFYACNENSPVTSSANQPGQTSVSIVANPNQGTTNIVVNKAKFLIEFVKIGTGSSSKDIRIGPFVCELNLGSVTQIGLKNIPEEFYKEIDLLVRAPKTGEPVIDPEMGSASSLMISGTYNGTNFMFRSGITILKVIEIEQGVRMNPTGLTNIDLMVNAKSWFMDNGRALNPMDEGNRMKIEDNIRNSFKEAFIDNNVDGNPD